MNYLKVIYSDTELMVIDKPPGLVVTPADTTKDQETLSDILKNEYRIELDRGGIAHRLDKDTSGIMLIAKTQKTLENLQFQFKERMVKKEYLALVHGLLIESKKVNGDILRHPGNREKFIVKDELRYQKDKEKEGREAETEVIPIQKFQIPEEKFQSMFAVLNKNQTRKLDKSGYGKFTLLRALPLTGRTHQIRVHLRYIGFPIVGDDKYGGRKTSRTDKKWCPRQFLHAAKINFYHPDTGQKMEFESPLPEDLTKALENLKKI